MIFSLAILIFLYDVISWSCQFDVINAKRFDEILRYLFQILATPLDCVFFLYWFFPYCSQSSQLILKNLILKFLKKHETSINLTTIFDFIGWFSNYIGFDEIKYGCVALLNILHINLQQSHKLRQWVGINSIKSI